MLSQFGPRPEPKLENQCGRAGPTLGAASQGMLSEMLFEALIEVVLALLGMFSHF
ncbi:MAG TPA: hypothetical protein VGG72_08795 [Bryobacteraceae bacterium]|jgi:hypothetical protein